MTRRPSYYAPTEWPTVVVIEPPEAIVTIEEARWQCAVTTDERDAEIDFLIRVAQAEIEPPDSWVGRSFGTQTLEATYTAWTDYDLPLPFPPIQEIVSVKYDDEDGVEQTLDESVYRLLGAGGASARLNLVSGETWPTVLDADEAIRIRYVAGYDLDDAGLLPAKQAVRYILGEHIKSSGDGSIVRSVNIPGVETREWFLSDATRTAIESMKQSLLSRYRVWQV